MGRWIDVGAVAELEFRPGALVELEGTRLAIFPLADGYRALENACPHANAPLCDGELEGDVLVCPMHRWEFDLRTGACDAGPAWSVPTFPARVRDGRLEVEWPDPTGPNGGRNGDGAAS